MARGSPLQENTPRTIFRNSGERLKLSYGAGLPIHDLDEYSDRFPWPASADGGGFSLTLIDVNQPLSPDHNDAASWRLSRFTGGSPGADDEVSLAAWMLLHGVSDLQSDEDGDGLDALLEFVLGGDPKVSSSDLLPVATLETIMVNDLADSYLTISFQHQVAT